ncbi:MAG: LysR family transcriptional regulator [Bradyrhizobium sp.]|nr:LysR family transcriptional regulator [Bradyrhizobium sp.]
MPYSNNRPHGGSAISGLDLRQLRYAVIAADYGSIRQAAEALLIKQSTISRSIRQLEDTLGVAVFARTSGGVQATDAGRQFLRMARSVLDQMDMIIAVSQANGRGESGRLTVGFCTSLTTGNLRATLLEFRTRFPHVQLGTIERSRARLVTALRNGAIDIHIVTGDAPSFYSKVMRLWSERILVVLPESHALAAQDVVYWTDLQDQTILLSQYDPGRELEGLLTTKPTSTSDRLRIERHDVSRGVLKSLVAMGLGLSLVLESDIGANFPGLTYREVRDGTGPSRLEFAAAWREDNESPPLRDFIKLLNERYPASFPV